MDVAQSLAEVKTLRDFESLAEGASINKHSMVYFSAGACSKSTPRHNEEALNRYRIRPRVLRDVSKTKLDCSILDSLVDCPIGISPTAMHELVHSDAELATAKGCCIEDCIFILSCCASRSVQSVAEEVLHSIATRPKLWMQIYILTDRSVTLDLIRKAESSGYSAIVVTVDSPNNGLWRKMMPRGFFEEAYFRLPNLPTILCNLADPSTTFEDLKWVIENSKLPVIAKGILSGEDAKRAVECGVKAIIVSNHGSRLIERVVPTIDVLEEIVDAMADTGVEVYVDGGIRSGTDIFIALALGAKAAFIGRPAIWGLSLNGENGVRKVLQILKEELLLTMQLVGVTRIEDIKRSMVMKT